MPHYLTRIVCSILIVVALPAVAAERLATMRIDRSAISVSGISSGAFMANQLHVAHSSIIMGAGLVAGGLYACASDGVSDAGLHTLSSIAVGPCMSTPTLLRSVDAYARQVRELEKRGWIDPVANLADDSVYLFTGRADKVVNSQTIRRAAALYQALGVPAANIELEDHALPAPGAGHSWVTEDFGVPCDANESPYINKCGYDQAGDLLVEIYGALKPAAAVAAGTLVEFDQTEFAPESGAAANGLFESGFLYVPPACAADGEAACRLHVVLHGCKQSAQVLGKEFALRIGVNEWADANDIVVLYPQARTIATSDFRDPKPTDLFEINPEGCWNWFGYGYDDFYPTRRGVQITAIRAMIDRVAGITD